MKPRIASSLLVCLCLPLLSASLLAQVPAQPLAPSDFAWQWPLLTGDADGAVRFTLTPAVYARITRPDLGDVAAFNAGNEAVPLGPATLAFERLVIPPAPAPLDAPLFRVPRESDAGGGERIALHIARGSDGRLSRLDAEVAPETAASGAHDLLIDVSALQVAVTALRIELDALPPAGLNARVEIAASDDLARWQVVGSELALVSLQENGLMLERRQLEIATTEQPYLRLRRTDADAALPVRAVQVLPTRRARTAVAVIPERQSFALDGRAVADLPGVFEFLSAGPFPVERVSIALADRNAVAGFVLESRAASADPWAERARGTAFRIGGNGNGVESSPLDLDPIRDRHWRIRTDPIQARAPTLTLTYRPEQFVLLTQGAPPYRLAAGSRNARRPDYPLRTVLAQMRVQYGDLWLPPEASLGADAPLSGDAALRAPAAPTPYRQWLLWGVLVAGAFGVIAMVVKLMRQPTTPGGAS